MKSKPLAISLLSLAVPVCLALTASAQEAGLKWIGSDASKDLGGYMPQRLKLSADKPAALKKAPADLAAPLYGEIKFGTATHILVLDEPAGRPSRLFVDSNANGDLTDDATTQWADKKMPGRGGGEVIIHMGSASLKLGTRDASLGIYRFDKSDSARAPLMDSIFYYRDYAFKGDVTLGGKTYAALLSDDLASGDFRGGKDDKNSGVRLLVDVNADGKLDPRRESFDVKKPFNIGGTTWELANLTTDGKFSIVKSSQTVEEIKPAPNLVTGAKAIPFTAKLSDGKPVKFPDDYKGKVVMLDFWATWCGPCIAELPNVISNYEKYHAKGFEILGISLDREKFAEKLAAFTKDKKMPWPQIYDGKFWQAEIAQLYAVEGIPFMLIVDGDTGEILASNVRGNQLGLALEEALAKKASK